MDPLRPWWQQPRLKLGPPVPELKLTHLRYERRRYDKKKKSSGLWIRGWPHWKGGTAPPSWYIGLERVRTQHRGGTHITGEGKPKEIHPRKGNKGGMETTERSMCLDARCYAGCHQYRKVPLWMLGVSRSPGRTQEEPQGTERQKNVIFFSSDKSGRCFHGIADRHSAWLPSHPWL